MCLINVKDHTVISIPKKGNPLFVALVNVESMSRKKSVTIKNVAKEGLIFIL
jgi:hypothetical protein